MIDTSKIKAGDEVQIDDSPNWRKVKQGLMNLYVVGIELRNLQSMRLITAHRPAEPVVPKGEGCVDWDKDVWCLYHDGDILKLNNSADCRNMILQGNVSNNRQHLERKRDRQRIEQELLECDGAVYEPVANAGCYGDKQYWGILPVGIISHAEDIDSAIMEFACHFISEPTARAALEKVGAERIRKAWGLDDDR